MLITGATTLVAQQKEQQVKDAAVSDGSLYEDIVNVPFDDKGLDITVHIAFDETDNLLTLSLTGTRQLFVFQDDTYRKKAFTGWFSRRSFHPERLSYPTLVEPKTKYKLTSPVVKSFNKPRKKHLFKLNYTIYPIKIQTDIMLYQHSSYQIHKIHNQSHPFWT